MAGGLGQHIQGRVSSLLAMTRAETETDQLPRRTVLAEAGKREVAQGLQGSQCKDKAGAPSRDYSGVTGHIRGRHSKYKELNVTFRSMKKIMANTCILMVQLKSFFFN